jgi:hypothetical protein
VAKVGRPSAVVAALLPLILAACGAGSSATTGDSPPAPSGSAAASSASPSPLVVNGVVVNELEVLQPRDTGLLAQELARHKGVVLSKDTRIGTLVVWFPTRSREEIQAVKSSLAEKNISANLVLELPPLS